MAKTVHIKLVVTDSDAWTPCWSAHAYGWDDAWWRESTLDGERCQCSAEKIARNREQGREIMAGRKGAG
jgi:hypothetical protein